MSPIKKFISYLFTSLFISFALNAEINYSLESLLNYHQSIQGFSYSSFFNSMKWQREDTSNEFMHDKDVKAVEHNFIRFCENFKKLPKQSYQTPPTEYSIPPIIHGIWLGSPAPTWVTSAFNSWKKYHPGWEIKIWTADDLTDFNWSNKRIQLAFEQAETWAEKADILRLEILYKFGGIYSDADVICLNSFHDLIVQDVGFLSSFELNYNSKHYGEAFFIGTAVMGAAKNSAVVKYCLDHLRSSQDAPTEGIIKRTGPGLISRACRAVLSNKEENILILPCSYLYPLPWKKKIVNSESVVEYVSPESLAIHLWDGSWCPPKKEK